MTDFFEMSYVLLCGIILLESLVLREALRETVRFKRVYARSIQLAGWHGLAAGTRSPRFSAVALGCDKKLRSSDLKGHSTVLFFISPQGASSPLYDNLAIVLHGQLHKRKGHVYVVCMGNEDLCKRFATRRLNGFPEKKILVDEDGFIGRAFRITDTPQAVELDSAARVERYGYPDVSAKMQEDGKEGLPVSATNDRRYPWPDDRSTSGAAFARMDTTISCILTRFRLNNPLSLIPFYFAFRRVRRDSRKIEGLLQALFLVEDARTCYTLSFWKDEHAIVEFGSSVAHIKAANSAFRHTYRKDLKRAEIWSAQFRLWAVSCHNMNWQGLDLQTLLTDQWQRREELTQMPDHVEEAHVG